MTLPVVLAIAGTTLMALAVLLPLRTTLFGRADGAPRPLPDHVLAAVADSLPDGPWPELVEPRATACDAATRLDLVEALAALDSAWARGILARAREQEADPAVHAAIVSALEPSV